MSDLRGAASAAEYKASCESASETTQQFRRKMNRGFDMMAGLGGDAGGPSAAQQTANWNATLVVPAAVP